MKILKTEVFLFDINYREPFQIAIEKTTCKKGILIKLTTQSGITGLGEASPARYVTGETIETVVEALKNFYFPAIKGVKADNIPLIHEIMEKTLKNNSSAKAAIDMALYDIASKSSDLPLYKYLGGNKNQIDTDITIGIKNIQDTVSSANKFVASNFKILKIKLGTTFEEDMEKIIELKKAVGKDITIRVDANQGWKTFEEAKKIIIALEPYNIELIEQPLPKNDIYGLARLKENVNILLAADESAQSLNDVKNLIENNAVDIINIKLMKCGGIFHAISILDYCKKMKIPCMMGGMCETKIAVSAATHLACASNNIKYADLDGDILIEDNIVKESSLALKDGKRILNDFPGLGIIKINEKRIFFENA